MLSPTNSLIFKLFHFKISLHHITDVQKKYQFLCTLGVVKLNLQLWFIYKYTVLLAQFRYFINTDTQQDLGGVNAVPQHHSFRQESASPPTHQWIHWHGEDIPCYPAHSKWHWHVQTMSKLLSLLLTMLLPCSATFFLQTLLFPSEQEKRSQFN